VEDGEEFCNLPRWLMHCLSLQKRAWATIY
jgi:hypothetical protein